MVNMVIVVLYHIEGEKRTIYSSNKDLHQYISTKVVIKFSCI